MDFHITVQKMNNEQLLAMEHPKSIHGGDIWEQITSALNKTRKRRQVATDTNLVQCGCMDGQHRVILSHGKRTDPDLPDVWMQMSHRGPG